MTTVLIIARLIRTTHLTSILANQIRRGSFRSVYRMNEAFLWHKQGAETFDFSFRYVEPELKVDRPFNLVRKVSEPVENFLKRLDVNLHKVLDKKKRKRSKKNPEIVVETVDNVAQGKIFLTQGEEVVSLSQPCSEFIERPKDLALTIFDQKYIIKYNAPWINEIELPECILVGFPVYPSSFDVSYTDKALSRFTWFRAPGLKSNNSRKEENNWEKIGEGFIYVPKGEDIGCRIKLSCVPYNESQEGPEVQVEGKGVVEAGPGVCPFETRHQFTKEKLNGKNFRIMSYNLLADTYADSDYSRTVLFPYCPPYALAIDYRKLLIVKELIGYNSDIICLQEVDKRVYEHDLLPALESVNFSGIYCPKGETSEGLAIFYDRRRFELIESQGIVLSKSIILNEAFSHIWDDIENEEAKKRFRDRTTTLLIATLKSLDNPDEIIVLGNTHLYFHPDADHVRLLQGYFALTACSDITEYTKKRYPVQNVTMLLSGDFNSSPKDGIYQLMTKNFVPADHENWRSNPDQIIEDISLSHNLSLDSACGTPEYTNFTVEFADCLDYIYYETNKLEVTQVIPMPSKEELSLHQAIPSVVFPSDHIAICADLKWK